MTHHIDLALQGGGSHGAITWGVLERLLEEPRLAFDGISGTSAGAMNAAVLASGMHEGGRQGAQTKLERFWRAVSVAAMSSPIQRDLWTRLSGQWSLDHSPAYLFFEQLSRLYSPYELNPLGINPLRDLLLREIDFAPVNACAAPRLFITATQVRTGRPRVFRSGEITVDVLLASAALPFLFHAVMIDGEAYWDGGYSGNPALLPLLNECEARDLVLVQINPWQREQAPRRARDIINRLNEITFNNSLLHELRTLELLSRSPEQPGLTGLRLHAIEGDDEVASLSASSKLNGEWAYLETLRQLGHQRAERWLQKHWHDLGVHSSFSAAPLLDAALLGRCAPPIDLISSPAIAQQPTASNRPAAASQPGSNPRRPAARRTSAKASQPGANTETDPESETVLQKPAVANAVMQQLAASIGALGPKRTRVTAAPAAQKAAPAPFKTTATPARAKQSRAAKSPPAKPIRAAKPKVRARG